MFIALSISFLIGNKQGQERETKITSSSKCQHQKHNQKRVNVQLFLIIKYCLSLLKTITVKMHICLQ